MSFFLCDFAATIDVEFVNFAERHVGRSLRIGFGGGGDSTPALGTLIGVAKTEAVASAYAATYPIALIAVVFVCSSWLSCSDMEP